MNWIQIRTQIISDPLNLTIEPSAEVAVSPVRLAWTGEQYVPPHGREARGVLEGKIYLRNLREGSGGEERAQRSHEVPHWREGFSMLRDTT